MAEVTVKVEGADEVAAALLDAGLMSQTLAQAMKAAVDLLELKAKQLAPKKRGYGSPKSIVSRIEGRVLQAGKRGVVRSKAPHSHLVEFGTKAHSLARGAGKSRKKPRKQLPKNYHPAMHPGSAKHPFMWPAADQAKPQVDAILAKHGNDFVTKVATRQVRRRKQIEITVSKP
jgi:HK97 gp10 family phage protein